MFYLSFDFLDKHKFSDLHLIFQKKSDSVLFFSVRFDFVEKHRFFGFALKNPKKNFDSVSPDFFSSELISAQLFLRFQCVLFVRNPLKNQRFSAWFLDGKKSVSFRFRIRFSISPQTFSAFHFSEFSGFLDFS